MKEGDFSGKKKRFRGPRGLFPDMRFWKKQRAFRACSFPGSGTFKLCEVEAFETAVSEDDLTNKVRFTGMLSRKILMIVTA